MKIKLSPGQKLYFTSDTHYDHVNICKATTGWSVERADNTVRDFDSLEHMNSTIIDGINNKVGEDDILIHLGDWSFNGFENIEKFRSRINCKNVHLILGNHDHHIKKNKDGIQSLFNSVNTELELEVMEDKNHHNSYHHFFLYHYPTASWKDMNKGIIHLHGHVHLPTHLKLNQGKAMDVGVDGNYYEPYSLREITNIMYNQPIASLVLPKDHHTKEI